MANTKTDKMKLSDWVFLVVISLVVSTCGVFGCSYVIGRGWPTLDLWLEIVLSLAITPVAALIIYAIDAAFVHYARKSVASIRLIGPPAPPRTPGERFRHLCNILTPKWKIGSIALFSLIMAIFWLPWFIANFPGGTYWDTYYQIYQVYPENHPIAVIPWAEIYDQTLTDAWLVDHHPVFTTIVYGLFGWVSDQLTGNWMAGVAIFCALQGIAHVVVFTSSVAYMRRVGAPPLLNLLSFAYFSLAPFVSTWAMCMVKDSFFGLFFIPYMMLVFETVRTRGMAMHRPRNAIIFALCALGLCLTKKTGIFVVVPTAIVGIVSFAARRRSQTSKMQAIGVKATIDAYAAQALLSVIVILVLFPMLVFPMLNIEKGGTQETLGPLFQQTARYVFDNPDDITSEEKEAIAKVLDYDKLDTEYQFDFQDSIKYRYNLDATPNDISNYLKVYVQQGLRHPDSYFAALMSLAGFYVAPTAYCNIRMVTVDTKMGEDQRYMLWNPDELDWLRLGLDDAYKRVGEIPVVDIPLLIVTYDFWLPALLAFVMFRHRVRGWTLFVPMLVLLGFCIIAPVYDARYVVPILDAAPIFFCGVWVFLRNTLLQMPIPQH